MSANYSEINGEAKGRPRPELLQILKIKDYSVSQVCTTENELGIRSIFIQRPTVQLISRNSHLRPSLLLDAAVTNLILLLSVGYPSNFISLSQ